jgi:hypothetical protein
MRTPSYLLMVSPVNFGYNPETAVNNSFQKDPAKNVQPEALFEFNALVELLRANEVNVTVIHDTADPHTPDSIFPNNWISFHEDNSLCLYPMFATNRREERKQHVFDTIHRNFVINDVYDLSHFEATQQFLEGTGSLVLDRENRIAYAALSPRTDVTVLNKFCEIYSYQARLFTAVDQDGNLIYHTNVLMSIGEDDAIICAESIKDLQERKAIISSLKNSGKEIVEISISQMRQFAGNALQITNNKGDLLLVMSTRAFQSLDADQVSRIEKYNRIIHSTLNTIEEAGGGSARCMIAEVFNSRR